MMLSLPNLKLQNVTQRVISTTHLFSKYLSTTQTESYSLKENLKPSKQPILIVGGGIAGLTMARACQIAKIPYLIFDKGPTFHTDPKAGTGIGLWGPAERIVNALGCGERIRSVSQRMSCAGYRTKKGTWLAQPPPIDPTRITSCLTLLRGDLIAALLDSLPENQLFINHDFTHYKVDEKSGTVTAFFKNGKSYEGSLLVAAEGINSPTRLELYPDTKSIYCEYSYYRAVLDLPPEKGSPYSFGGDLNWYLSNPEVSWESWAKDCRIAYVPLKTPQVFWFISETMSEEESNEEFRRVKKLHTEKKDEDNTLPKELSAKVSDWHNPIPQLIEKTPPSNIIFTSIKKVVLDSSKWINPTQRVVLIGDAAHAVPPNLASGGMMSMQDAIQLVSSLRPLYSDPSSAPITTEKLDSALKSYLKFRKYKTKIIQISSNLVAVVGQLSNPLLLTLRDRVIQFMPTIIRNKIFNFLHRFYLGWNYTAPNLGQGLYPRLFPRDIWNKEMPELLKRFHEQSSIHTTSHICEGEATTKAGSSILAKMIALIVSMPPSITTGPVSVRIQQNSDGSELWTRHFTDPETGKKHKFETIQYIENEAFVEVINPFNLGLAHIEVLMGLTKLSISGKGFNHVYKDVRFRIFPFIYGGFTVRVPKFLQPVAHGVTRVHESGAGWTFDVGIKAPDNWLWRAFMGKDSLHIAGYTGNITKFDKPSVVEWLNTQTIITSQNLSQSQGKSSGTSKPFPSISSTLKRGYSTTPKTPLFFYNHFKRPKNTRVR